MSSPGGVPKGGFNIVVLEDGTLKITSGDFGGVQHQSAEAFLALVKMKMGGAENVQQPERHHHHHHHEQDHTHTHEGH